MTQDTPTSPVQNTLSSPVKEKSNNTMLFLLIGGIVLFLCFIVFCCLISMFFSSYSDQIDRELYDTDPPAIREEDINDDRGETMDDMMDNMMGDYRNDPMPSNGVDFGIYDLIYLKDWKTNGVFDSYIEMDITSENCLKTSKNLYSNTEENCTFAVFTSDDYSYEIYITDTEKVKLGQDGFVPTVVRERVFGGVYFDVVYSGTYSDENMTKIDYLLVDGERQVSYVTGCLKKDLCIHMDAMTGNNGKDIPEIELEGLSDFVSGLKY